MQRKEKDVENMKDGLLNHIETGMQRNTSLNQTEQEQDLAKVEEGQTNIAKVEEGQTAIKNLLGDRLKQSDGFQKVAQTSIMNAMRKVFENTLLEDVKKRDVHANRLKNGKEIQRMILTNTEDQVELAFQILHEDIRVYKQNFFKSYVCTLGGVAIGFIVAPITMALSQYLGLALYNRAGLDHLTEEFLGNNTWDNIIQDDLLVTTFDYNSETPRFYSKYFVETDPGNYNFPIKFAAAASASAPVAFNPLLKENRYNITEALIDGGVICNNPALYAYMIAHDLRGKKNFRIMSLGTGVGQSVIDDYGNTNPIDNKGSQGTQLFNYMMNIEVANANRILDEALNGRDKKTRQGFVRLQTQNEVSSIANSEYWFNILKQNGDNMWNKPLNLR